MTYVRLILAALLSVLWLPAAAQPHSSASMPGQAGEAIAPDGAAAKTDSIVVLTAEEYRRLICGSDMRAERRAWRRERIDRHELRAGIGSLGIISYLLVDGLYGCCYDMAYRGFRDQMISAGIYTTPEWFTGNIAASYGLPRQAKHAVRRHGSLCRYRIPPPQRRRRPDDRQRQPLRPLRDAHVARHMARPSRRAGVFVGGSGCCSAHRAGISPRGFCLSSTWRWWAVRSAALCSGNVELGSGAGGILRCGVGYRFDAAAKTKRSRR